MTPMRVALAAALLASALATPAAAVAADRAKPERTRVAVLDVRALDKGSNVAAKIATQVVLAEHSHQQRLNVMSASDITAIIGAERHKQLVACAQSPGSGCLTELSAALGARYVVSGTLAGSAKKRKLELRLLDAQGTTIKQGAKTVPDDRLEDEVRAIAQALIQAIPVPKPEPAPAPAVEKAPPDAAVEAGETKAPRGRTLPFTLLIGGALAAGGGGYLAYDALSWNRRKLQMYPELAQATRTQAQTRLVVGYALAGVGAAAIVSGAVLLATSGASDAAVAVVPTEGGALVGAAVRF